MLVLWLERDIYRGSYYLSEDGGQRPRPWRQTWQPFWRLGDNFVDFGDKIKVLKNSGIFSISLLGAESYRIYYMIVCDVTSCQLKYKSPEVAEMRQSSLSVFGAKNLIGHRKRSAIRL
ncbi:hypothetical protein AVEN_22916-1 [Araneus ventricosus]|uniref:Uncharacterized protein n=1 Tax=Araneus ventricosus TaxID=182803 RepID=A0A4Y2D738_ARAVE|nr:hypothetical protein AVEN_22916-1 [Araneus ventricosus]